MALPDGWSDGEVLRLLRLMRKHMTLFIYATDETFALTMQRHLRCGKSVQDIKDAVRELMDGLAFAMKTRKFTNDVLSVDGVSVFPHEHLYETMAMQPENRQGGVWDPDELRMALRKMETYRHGFEENPELYFARAQIWSKNVPDVRTKFYLWRELYEDEAAEQTPRSDGELKRLDCLHKIFEGVPPAPSPLPPTPSPIASSAAAMASPGSVTAVTGKPPKVRLWTPDDLDAFVQLLVEITLDLQTKGTSPLIQEIGVRLNRTEPSLLSKVQDIRARFEKGSAYLRAAEIPSVIYDTTSVAHKIFTADWSDREDPYALAVFALKELQNRALARMKNKSKQARPPPLRMEMRHRSPTAAALPSPGGTAVAVTTPTPTIAAQQAKPQIHPVTKVAVGSTTSSSTTSNSSKPPRVSPTASPSSLMYSEFVRDCAAMIKWDEARTYQLCLVIQTALPTYATTSRSVFYEDVVGAMGDSNDVNAQVVYFRGERILRLCERRYGSLDCFAAAVEGNGASLGAAAHATSPSSCDTPKHLAPHSDIASEHKALETMRPPIAMNTPPPDAPSDDCLRTVADLGARPAQRSPGKSHEKAKRIRQQKTDPTQTVATPTDRTESSPSVHHESPHHDEFGDDDADHDAIGDTPMDDEHDAAADDDDNEDAETVDNSGEHGDDALNYDNDDDDGDQTQSLDSSDASSDASSDYGHDTRRVTVHRRHVHRNRSVPYDRHHGHGHRHGHALGKVHVSSRKTLVVKHAPHPCYCDECGRTVRRHQQQQQHQQQAVVTSIHRKRSRSELRTSGAQGRWVEDHEVEHRHIDRYDRRYGRDDAAYNAYDDHLADDEAALLDDGRMQHDVAELDSMWSTLMAPIENGIGELEAKRREQRERAVDREKRERETHWKKELRQQVRDEWQAVLATTTMASTTTTTGSTAHATTTTTTTTTTTATRLP